MGDRWLTVVLEPEPDQPVQPDPERQTSDRWLTVELEPEPDQPDRRPLALPPERRPVRIALPAPPPKRRALWSLVAGVALICGIVAVLLGAWLVSASGVSWNESVREATAIREDLANRSQAAMAALTNELADLEPTASILAEVSTALEAAARLAADLEAVASGGPASGPEDALRAAGAELMAVSDIAVPVPGAGFGPFVLRDPLPGHSVTDSFGTRRDDTFHGGIDIGAPAGTPILAAADGVVLQSGWLDGGAGNGVILLHEQGWETRYFHMVSADLPVATGDSVLAGQVIGNVGSTGDSTGPHLHFEVVYGPIRMDPERGFTYIDGEVGTVDPAIDPPLNESPVIDPAPIDLADTRSAASAAERSAADVAALSDAAADIANVQQELLDIAADASDQAVVLEERRVAEQDRARTAALILYGGAAAVVFGLLLLLVTRPPWPATR